MYIETMRNNKITTPIAYLLGDKIVASDNTGEHVVEIISFQKFGNYWEYEVKCVDSEYGDLL